MQQKQTQLWGMVLYGGIPCNLAPAHFTVHVVQVRLNFALGFVVEANPASEIHSLSCVFFGFGFLFHTGQHDEEEGEEIDPDLPLLWLSPFSFPSGLCTEEGWFGRRFGSREDRFPLSKKYYRRNFGFYTVLQLRKHGLHHCQRFPIITHILLVRQWFFHSATKAYRTCKAPPRAHASCL